MDGPSSVPQVVQVHVVVRGADRDLVRVCGAVLDAAHVGLHVKLGHTARLACGPDLQGHHPLKIRDCQGRGVPGATDVELSPSGG